MDHIVNGVEDTCSHVETQLTELLQIIDCIFNTMFKDYDVIGILYTHAQWDFTSYVAQNECLYTTNVYLDRMSWPLNLYKNWYKLNLETCPQVTFETGTSGFDIAVPFVLYDSLSHMAQLINVYGISVVRCSINHLFKKY